MYPWSRNRLWAVNLRLSAFEEVVPKDGEGGGEWYHRWSDLEAMRPVSLRRSGR